MEEENEILEKLATMYAEKMQMLKDENEVLKDKLQQSNYFKTLIVECNNNKCKKYVYKAREENYCAIKEDQSIESESLECEDPDQEHEVEEDQSIESESLEYEEKQDQWHEGEKNLKFYEQKKLEG